jgi:hypothetical protein
MRVRLIAVKDHWTQLKPGALGTVNFIDSAGTVHCEWDDSSGLGLVDGVDRWEVISDQQADGQGGEA